MPGFRKGPAAEAFAEVTVLSPAYAVTDTQQPSRESGTVKLGPVAPSMTCQLLLLKPLALGFSVDQRQVYSTPVLTGALLQ